MDTKTESIIKIKPANKIPVRLFQHFGQETEGVIHWCFIEQADLHLRSQGSVKSLKEGDYLEILNDQNAILWGNIIEHDLPGQYDYYMEPTLGREVRFMQKGMDPKMWNKWFVKKFNGNVIRKTNISES